MASKGIKDRVAIVGMGCTKFGEHWDQGADDLLVDAAGDAFRSAGVDPAQVDAYWLGTMGSGTSGLVLSEALKQYQAAGYAQFEAQALATDRVLRGIFAELGMTEYDDGVLWKKT